MSYTKNEQDILEHCFSYEIVNSVEAMYGKKCAQDYLNLSEKHLLMAVIATFGNTNITPEEFEYCFDDVLDVLLDSGLVDVEDYPSEPGEYGLYEMLGGDGVEDVYLSDGDYVTPDGNIIHTKD